MNFRILACTFGFIATVSAILPYCYISPFAAALNTTTCAPLDVECICQSNTFIEATQVDVPQACPVADQKPIFSHIEAACNGFGSTVSFSTTSVPLTTSTAQTETITRNIGLMSTPTAGASRSGSASSQECTEPALSTGASAGLIVAAFIIGGIAAALGTILSTRRGKSRGGRQTPAGSRSTVWHDWSPPMMPHTQTKPVIIAEANASPQRSELMGSKDNESL